MEKQLVWDIPTRAFHWLLVLMIGVSWLSGENDWMDIHQLSGLTILGLILFRILWGFAGSRYARFSGFVAGPVAVKDYALGLLKRDKSHAVGHNPLGGWSALALMAVVAVTASIGLFAGTDDYLFEGPFYSLVSTDTSERMASRHETAFDLILVLAAIHIASIAFYLVFHRTNLIRPMVIGTKEGIAPEDAATPPNPVLAAILFLGSLAIAHSIPWWV